jgi:hypothetical protein
MCLTSIRQGHLGRGLRRGPDHEALGFGNEGLCGVLLKFPGPHNIGNGNVRALENDRAQCREPSEAP